MRPDLSGVDPLELNLATRFSVGDLLTRSAQLFGARTAIVDPSGREVSYAELDAAAEACGRGLAERDALGVERGRAAPVQAGGRSHAGDVGTGRADRR